MAAIEVNGKAYELDDEGHLVNLDDWTPELVRELARRDDIDPLTDEHLRILNYIREYRRQHGVAPMLNLLQKDCDIAYRELHRLFKKNPGKRAAKLAGLPKQEGCV